MREVLVRGAGGVPARQVTLDRTPSAGEIDIVSSNGALSYERTAPAGEKD